MTQNQNTHKITPKNAYPLSFYQQDTFKISHKLLGSIIATKTNGKLTAGIITEVEPYFGSFDKASHAYPNKKTPRTAIQFEPGGFSYVFFVYGMYHQFCVVTNKKNIPDAILIRAVLPISGLKTMAKRRYKKAKKYETLVHKIPDTLDLNNIKNKPKQILRNLTNGPGKLTIALNITKKLNEIPVNSIKLWIQPFLKLPKNQIAQAKRIGIDYAEEYAEKPWRFYIKQEPFVWWVSRVE